MNFLRLPVGVSTDFKTAYSILREQSGLPLLYVQRIRVSLIKIYKMHNLLRPMYLHSILSKHAKMTSTRNNVRVVQPICHTPPYGLSRVRYCGATLWNEIDKQLKESVSLEDCKLDWSNLFLFDL